ncbi:MAG: hypothetical protein QXP42_00255 [Candidatus Micrarchaeia archaeon]
MLLQPIRTQAGGRTAQRRADEFSHIQFPTRRISLRVDLSDAIIPIAEVKRLLRNEISLIPQQLSAGYKFDGHGAKGYEEVDNFVKNGIPIFQLYSPLELKGGKSDFQRIEELARKYDYVENIVVIGNGGSVTSSKFFYRALGVIGGERKAYFLDTVDPIDIAYVKRNCKPENTLIIPVSKSGTTVSVLQTSMAFLQDGYPFVPITTRGKGTLYDIAVRMGVASDILEIPDGIGGRYSGRTPCGYFPARMMGLDIQQIDEGAREMYQRVGPTSPFDENPALQLAATLRALEIKNEIDTIFTPMYSHQLDEAATLIMQLMHESSAKLERGQTILCVTGPESQHHTNTRFLGGKRNMAGLFFVVKNRDVDVPISAPQQIENLTVSGTRLGDMKKLTYGQALEIEYLGTRGDARNRGIPTITVEINEITEKSVGELLAFFHYAFGVYPALLRNVNPFDQPDVEGSKEISRQLTQQVIQTGRLNP